MAEVKLELQNMVFIWGEDKQPDDQVVQNNADVSRSILFIHTKTTNEAILMYKNVENRCGQIFHTAGVPASALTYFGGKVLAGGR